MTKEQIEARCVLKRLLKLAIDGEPIVISRQTAALLIKATNK